DRLPQGDPSRARGRARLPLQVEPRLDARYLEVLRYRSRLSTLAPQPADFWNDVHLQRAVPPFALPRRGGAREGVAPYQDGGRRLAEVRQPARDVFLDVGASGQEAALHGQRIRPAGRGEPRSQPRL